MGSKLIAAAIAMAALWPAPLLASLLAALDGSVALERELQQAVVGRSAAWSSCDWPGLQLGLQLVLPLAAPAFLLWHAPLAWLPRLRAAEPLFALLGLV